MMWMLPLLPLSFARNAHGEKVKSALGAGAAFPRPCCKGLYHGFLK